MFNDPKTLAVLKHVAILAVLGAISAALLPAWTAIAALVGAASLPPAVQAFTAVILPLVGAAVMRFQAQVAAELAAEQAAKQVAAANAKVTALESKLAATKSK